MKPRYTKRVREEAALICAIAASSNRTSFYTDIVVETDASDAAHQLACAAFNTAISVGLPHTNSAESCRIDAEAESLIRCGWSPK